MTTMDFTAARDDGGGSGDIRKPFALSSSHNHSCIQHFMGQMAFLPHNNSVKALKYALHNSYLVSWCFMALSAHIVYIMP